MALGVAPDVGNMAPSFRYLEESKIFLNPVNLSIDLIDGTGDVVSGFTCFVNDTHAFSNGTVHSYLYRLVGNGLFIGFICLYVLVVIVAVVARKVHPLSSQPVWLIPITGNAAIYAFVMFIIRETYFSPYTFPCTMQLLFANLMSVSYLGPYAIWILHYRNSTKWNRSKLMLGDTPDTDIDVPGLLKEKWRAGSMYLFRLVIVFIFTPSVAIVVTRMIMEREKYFRYCIGCTTQVYDLVVSGGTGLFGCGMIWYIVASSPKETRGPIWKRHYRRAKMFVAVGLVHYTLLGVGVRKFVRKHYLINVDILILALMLSTFYLDGIVPCYKAMKHVLKYRPSKPKVQPEVTQAKEILPITGNSTTSLKMLRKSLSIEDLVANGFAKTDEKYVELLKEFELQLVEEYSVENISFLKSVLDFKREKNLIRPNWGSFSKAKGIYEKFIKDGSLAQVNLDCATTNAIKLKTECPPPDDNAIQLDIFDAGYFEVCTILRGDSFRRFKAES